MYHEKNREFKVKRRKYCYMYKDICIYLSLCNSAARGQIYYTTSQLLLQTVLCRI